MPLSYPIGYTKKAEYARGRRTLFPVRIDNIQPPIGFRRLQTADLLDWDATKRIEGFDRLIADIAALIEPPPAGEPAPRAAVKASTSAEEETSPSQKTMSIPLSTAPERPNHSASGGGPVDDQMGREHTRKPVVPLRAEIVPKPSNRETASLPSPAPVHPPQSQPVIKVVPTKPSPIPTNKEQATSPHGPGVAGALLVAVFFNVAAVSIYYILVYFNARVEARFVPLYLNFFLALLFAYNDWVKGDIKARLIFIFNILFTVFINIYFGVR
jgi:hypothetical protein